MTLLLAASLYAFAGRAATIKIYVDNLFSPRNTDSKPYGFSELEVSDQITAADLVEKINFHGKVFYDDWDWQRSFSRKAGATDNGGFLKDAYSNSMTGEFDKMIVSVFYAGEMMRPTSTLRSNGVRDKSTVLIRRERETSKISSGTSMVYVKATYNGKNEYMYFHRREDMWNMANYLSFRYGLNVEDASFAVEGKGTMTFEHDPDRVFLTLGKVKDDSGKNPISIGVSRTKACTCMSASEYASKKGVMTKRLGQLSYGLGCGAHDEKTKTCNDKNIKKGNRECWCPRKWCYVNDGCGDPSAKFPGLSFAYDVCQNNNNVDCFASDTEGVEGAQLSDFDIWTFPKVTGYLRQMVAVLVEAVPSLEKAFRDSE